MRALLGVNGITALVLAGSLSGALNPAWAADLPLKAPPPPPAAVFSWTGFYVGGNLGGKWANVSDTVNFAPLAGVLPAGASQALSDTTPSTVLGGIQLGYNWQAGRFVYGLEGDIDAQHWSETQVLGTFSQGTLFVPGDAFSVESHWQASIRARLGYAWDRTLLYATGGLALTDVRASSLFVVFGPDPATAGSDSATLVGGTVGGGLEYAFSNVWSAAIEGRYTWYGSHTFNTGTVALAAPPAFDPVSRTVDLNTAEVLAKINYRFWK